MGIGMQIAYFGFPGSAEIEAEASVELVRLDRFSKLIGGCRLAIEAWSGQPAHRLYDARLDLITRDYGLIPVERCTDEDPHVAVRGAFDTAVRVLEKGQGRR
jgi:hypothetical protein